MMKKPSNRWVMLILLCTLTFWVFLSMCSILQRSSTQESEFCWHPKVHLQKSNSLVCCSIAVSPPKNIDYINLLWIFASHFQKKHTHLASIMVSTWLIVKNPLGTAGENLNVHLRWQSRVLLEVPALDHSPPMLWLQCPVQSLFFCVTLW